MVSELVKSRLNRGERPSLSFWRDSNGNETDVIAEEGEHLRPIEIKSGQTLNQDFFKGLERWTTWAGHRATRPTLVYGGIRNHRRSGVEVFGWDTVETLLG